MSNNSLDSTNNTGLTSGIEVLAHQPSSSDLSHLQDDEELLIIHRQLEADVVELDDLDSRLKADTARIKEKNDSIDDLEATIVTKRHGYTEILRQIQVEQEVYQSIERLSRDYASTVAASALSAELIRLNFEHTQNLQSIMGASLQGFRSSLARETQRIAQMENSPGAEQARVRILVDERNSLEMSRGPLITSIERKTALLGTIRRLPTKILARVFLSVIDAVIFGRIIDPSSIITPHPALAIASVCRRWREVALNIPDLWQYVPIYELPSLDLYPRLPMPAEAILKKARAAKGLFIDWTRASNEHKEEPMRRWAEVLKSMAGLASDEKLDPDTHLTLHFSGEAPMSLNIRFFELNRYTLHNVYPNFTRDAASHVKQLKMHFCVRPKLSRVPELLLQVPYLIHLEISFKGRPYHKPQGRAIRPSLPQLKYLTSQLSMLPLFFEGKESVSKRITHLRVIHDVPSDIAFLSQSNWASTVKSTGLSASLRYIALEGSTSIGDTETRMAPLLQGLYGVSTLALHGPFMDPILKILSRNFLLRPALQRLEMLHTNIDSVNVAAFVNSRRNAKEPGSQLILIRELVLDCCSNIARVFCDRYRDKLDKLVVYV